MVKKGFCMGFNLEIAMICPVANLAMTVTFFRLPEKQIEALSKTTILVSDLLLTNMSLKA